MAGDWKDNRKIQFAVGATVIFLLLRWLLTGDLLMVAEAARPPADGETKSVTILAVVWPMLIEAVIIVGISAIAFGLRIWSWVVDLIDSARGVVDPVVAGSSPASITKQSGISIASADDRNTLVTDLAQAVARNDTESERSIKTQIRLPYAIEELNAKIREGNFAGADKLMAEIKKLSGKEVKA